MSVVRWSFQDMLTSEIYTVEVNPNTAGGLRFPKEYEFSTQDGGRVRGVRQRPTPVDWTFGGVVIRETHHDALIDWQRRRGKVRITDHLGRTVEAMIQGLDMTDRQQTATKAWRFRYQFSCLILRRIA